MDILQTVAACDLKVARCRQLLESMKVSNYLRPSSFLDLDRSFKYQDNDNRFLRNHWVWKLLQPET